MNVSSDLMVSVIVITYNHSNYIAECINGLLAQKTSFPIEIIIGDDCSIDNNRKIIQKITDGNKDELKDIKLLFHKKNLISSNSDPGKLNFLSCLEASNGKYIAYCEGDDFWCDPLKLQKQVDFLEQNLEYTLCVHNSNLVDQNGVLLGDFSGRPNRLGTTAKLSGKIPAEKILFSQIALFHTTSYCIRRTSIYDRVMAAPKHIRSGDFVMLFGALEQGSCYYMNDICSSYREHTEGVTKSYQSKVEYEHVYKSYIDLYTLFLAKHKIEYRSIFECQIAYYQYQIAENNYAEIRNRWYSRFTLAYFGVRAAKAKWQALEQKVKKQFSCVE